MQRGRAYKEAMRLGEEYPVEYSETERRVRIRQFRYPEPWEPTFGEVLYLLPKTYPNDVPDVYIPTEMSYGSRGTSVEHFMTVSHPSSEETDWGRWCIRKHKTGWDPNEDSLLKLTQMLRASLKYPDSDNPFEEIA